MTNLHLGCGPIHLPNFINIDHSDHWKPDICMDYLQLDTRFDENSVDHVFSCHSLEHVAYPAGVTEFFRQVHRVLKPGGTLRLVVPDLRKVAKAYVNGSDLKEIYGGNFFYHHDCPAERFLYFMREWQHTVVFDCELLFYFVSQAGFSKMARLSFGQSDIPVLKGIDRYQSESLSVECRK